MWKRSVDPSLKRKTTLLVTVCSIFIANIKVLPTIDKEINAFLSCLWGLLSGKDGK